MADMIKLVVLLLPLAASSHEAQDIDILLMQQQIDRLEKRLYESEQRAQKTDAWLELLIEQSEIDPKEKLSIGLRY